MNSTRQPDDIDITLMAVLQERGRTKSNALAETTGLSLPAVTEEDRQPVLQQNQHREDDHDRAEADQGCGADGDVEQALAESVSRPGGGRAHVARPVCEFHADDVKDLRSGCGAGRGG